MQALDQLWLCAGCVQVPNPELLLQPRLWVRDEFTARSSYHNIQGTILSFPLPAAAAYHCLLYVILIFAYLIFEQGYACIWIHALQNVGGTTLPQTFGSFLRAVLVKACGEALSSCSCALLALYLQPVRRPLPATSAKFLCLLHGSEGLCSRMSGMLTWMASKASMGDRGSLSAKTLSFFETGLFP